MPRITVSIKADLRYYISGMAVQKRPEYSVSYISIKNYDLGAAEDVLETLFWLDIKNGIDLFPLQPEYPKDNSWEYRGSYNEPESKHSRPPFGIVMHYGLVNDFLAEWSLRKTELQEGTITFDQYNNWKWNWPNSCDDYIGKENYADWQNL